MPQGRAPRVVAKIGRFQTEPDRLTTSLEADELSPMEEAF